MTDEETLTTEDTKQLFLTAAMVARVWIAACDAEPMMIELLLPGELRYALGELTKVVGA